MQTLTLEQVKQLMPILRLTVGKRKFIMVNDEPACNTAIQKIWSLRHDIYCDTCRMNWITGVKGETKSGYDTQEEYEPVVQKIIEWLEHLKVKDPEPSITIKEGYKIYFDGNPVGSKFDYEMTEKCKHSFPSQFYRNFCVSFDKDETMEILKKQILYMLDQLKIKGRYASLGEMVKNQLKTLKFI